MFPAMLAEDADKPPQHYIDSDNWWGFQKFDGRRLMVAVLDGEVIPMNRKGEPFKFPIDQFKDDLVTNFNNWWLDGEWIDGTYVIFDVLYVGSKRKVTLDATDFEFQDRYNYLNINSQIKFPHLKIAPPARSPQQKQDLLLRLRTAGCEGIIFRNIHSRYIFGKRSASITKVKFWKTADCVIYNVGREGKNSASIAMFQNSEPVGVGAVTLTEARMKTVQVGQVVECKYLYATDSHKLFQPSFLRIRDDKDAFDCTLDQLEYTDKNKVL